MNLERLAYIALKEIVKNEDRQGEIRLTLKSKGIELSDINAREVGRYIKSNGLGKVNEISLGRVIVRAGLSATEFVNKHTNMTFEQKLKLIYSELENLPTKKGKLEDILDKLSIDHDPHTEKEFLDSFKETGNVHITATTKDGSIIVLTQKGHDNLHAPAEKSNQPNIHIQDNPNSIINIGGSQSGSFESGIKKDKAVINKTPSENPSNKNKPASPTKTWQIIGVIVSVIGVSLTILKLLNLI